MVRVLFTAELTAANASTALVITYNSVNYNVKVCKDGSLVNYTPFLIGSTYKYCQAYTTLEFIYDGTNFIVLGNPVVISSSDYTIYPDGTTKYNKTKSDSLQNHVELMSKNRQEMGAFTETINNLSNYQAIIIRCVYGNEAGQYYDTDNYIEIKNVSDNFTIRSSVFYSNTERFRVATINLSNNTITFTSGYAGSTTANDGYCIPLKIWGIPKA